MKDMVRGISISLLFGLLLILHPSLFGQNSPRFTENKGQLPDNVEYTLRVANADLFFEKDKITFGFYAPHLIDRHDHGHAELESNFFGHAYRMHFVDASANAEVVGQGEPYPDYRNYITRNRAVGHVLSYHRMRYENIYDGVNFEYFGTNGHLKYDVVISAGVDPSVVKLKYEGADAVYLKNGNLIVENTFNTVEESIPLAYQVINGNRKRVACNYLLVGTTVSFEFPDGYDAEAELVIDPTLIFASLAGSLSDNFGFTATYDHDGALYGGGIVFGSQYPFVTGSYDSTFEGYYNVGDIGISKFMPDGSGLEYSTYLGGSETDTPHSMVVNSSGELVILGSTSSADYPILPTSYDSIYSGGSYQDYVYNGTTFNQGSDIIVTILSADGSSLIGSTYLGGAENDGLNDYTALRYNYNDAFRGEVIVDSDDNIYIASSTESADLPVTVGAFGQSLGGVQDACVAKFNSDVSVLLWCSYLGGTSADAGYSLKLNSSGDLYVTGGTNSQDFPIVGAALNSTFQGGIADGFVARIANDGSAILNSSFFGTSAYDQSYFVEIDDDDDIYLYGQSTGSYPVGGVDYFNLNGKQFIQKLTPDLSSSVYSTVFGSGSSSINISPTAFLVDICERVYISGWGGVVNGSPYANAGGNTTGMPITSNAIQLTTDGSDFYFMVLESDADSLLYGSFFGGASAEHVDGGTSRFDRNGIIYQAVCASCGGANDFPATPGAWSEVDPSGGDSCNLGVIKLDFDITGVDVNINGTGNISGCAPLEVQFNADLVNASSFVWYFGDGDTSSVQNPVHVFDEPGNYEVMLIGADTSYCTGEAFTDTAFVTVNVTLFADAADAGADQLCLEDSAQVGTPSLPGYSYSWEPPTGLDDPTVAQPNAGPDELTEYILTVTNAEGCEDHDTVLVSIGYPIAAFDVETSQSCAGDSVRFINQSENSASFYWNIGTVTSEESDPIIVFQAGEGPIVTLYAYNGGCVDSVTIDFTTGWFSEDSLDPFLPPVNVFTPNGDQINDCFTPMSIEELEDCFELKVYSRWGRLLYDSEKQGGTCWDGTQRSGGLVAQGTYYYIATVRGMDRAGYVTVIRE